MFSRVCLLFACCTFSVMANAQDCVRYDLDASNQYIMIPTCLGPTYRGCPSNGGSAACGTTETRDTCNLVVYLKQGKDFNAEIKKQQ